MKPLFELLLLFHPPAFRSRFGEEGVAQATRECRRAFRRGVAVGCLIFAHTCLDLARSGLAERWSPTWPGTTGRHPIDYEGTTMTTRVGHWIRNLMHAGRGLWKSPGFTAAAVGTLALALGANAAIFSVVDAVLLDALPYEEPDRLVYIAASAPGSDFPEEFPVALEFFLQYRAEADQLESVATFNSFTATVRADDRVERLRVSMPSVELFETLGVSPVLGRLPVPGEGEQVALLSHAFWTTWFGRSPDVLGRSFHIAGAQREVVGVMGPELGFPRDEVVAWVPVERTGADLTVARFGLRLVGRLAPGADRASLSTELQAVASRLPELYGGPPAYARLIEQHVPVVRPLDDFLLGSVSRALQVLLVASANLANLFTVRTRGRGRALAVRRALGAGRAELVRSQLAEALLVALASAGLALLLAWLLLPTLVGLAPDGVPGIDRAALSGTTVAFTAAAAGVAALMFGLVPAVRASAPDLARLRDGQRGSTHRRPWGRDVLVVGQTALTLVLLVGSGLLLRSFQELRARDPGYDTEGIVTFQFAPEQDHLTDGPSWARFHHEVMDRLRALPMVEAVGIVENVPLDETTQTTAFVTGDQASADPSSGPQASLTMAGGDYFRTMGIEVLQGRGFTEEDAEVGGRVVVSRAAADLLWPGEDPMGRRLRNVLVPGWHTVVGVVEDVIQGELRDDPIPLVYYPLVGPEPDSWALSSPGYAVRSSRPAERVPEIRALIGELAPEAPVYRVHTMRELTSRSLVQLSFTMFTLAVAAGLALLLGAVGLYGVLSHVVAERTREIGVRMALGAERTRVERMVVGQGARVVGVGIVLGLGVALAATRVMDSLLYGVGSGDVATFAATAVVLAGVGLLASWLPARRAARVDPVESMRVG